MRTLGNLCSGRKRLIVLLAIVGALTSGLAYAYFTTSSASGSDGQSRSGSLQPPTGVGASASGGTVSVSWTASGTSASSPAPQGYYVTRTNTSTQVTSPACGSSSSNLITGSTTCADSSVPNGTYTYTVTAAFNAWTATTTSNTITVTATPPSITLTPTSAHVGDAVSVSGSSFPPSAAVSATYDGAPVQLSPATSTNSSGSFSGASFTVPVGVAGPHTIKMSAGGDAATATLTVSPTISLSPASGPSGNTVTISGSGFAAGKTITATLAGSGVSLAGTTTTSADGRFGGASFTVPSGTTGAKNVTVADASGNSASAGFTQVAGPSLTLSPASAVAGAGTQVTVSGSGYTTSSAITVKYDGQTQTTSPVSPSTNSSGVIPTGVRFTVPTGSGSGAHTVQVTAGGQTGTATVTLAPAAASSPTVVDGTGATTTITGTNQAALNVKVTLPPTSLSSDVVHVTLTDGTHTTTDASAAATQGAGTATVSGIDARGLNDGSITVNTSIRDSLGDSSSNASGTTAKTIAPTAVQPVDGSGNALSTINMLNQSSTNVKVILPAGARGGDLVHVTLSDGAHSTADQSTTIPANNTASVTVSGIDASTLNDGANNITINATVVFPTSGGTGTSAAKTATTSKDTLPPGVTSINDAAGSPTNHSSITWTVTFSGSVTGVDSSDFHVVTSGSVGAPTVSGVSGSGASYTVTVNNISPTDNATVGLNLVDNDSILDAAGNPVGGPGGSGTSGDGSFVGQTYTIDTTAPAAPVIASPATNSWSGPTVTLAGTAEPNSSVQIYEGATAQSTAVTANPAGNWTQQLTAAPAGSHTYTAKATDAAGNISGSSNAVTVQVDATAPVVSASTIAKTEGLPNSSAGAIRQGGTYYIYTSVTDTGGSGLATVTANVSAISGSGATSLSLHPCQSNCTVNGTSYNYVSNQQTASTPLTAGSATYVITVTDGVGNQGNSGTGGQAKTVNVDNTAPSISSVSTKNGGATAGVIEQADTITFAYSAPIDGASILNSWAWNWTTPQNVEVKVIDGGAGNDTMQILSVDGSTVLPFGTIDLGSKNFITTGGYAILGTTTSPSTMTRATNQQDPYTIVFGAPNNAVSTGTLATSAVTNDTITWSSSSPTPVYDAAGNILSNTPSSVTNSGTGSVKTQF